MAAGDAVAAERRRLAGMLPGADVEPVASGFVALVSDVDAPIPVLVERGGYELLAGGEGSARSRSRRLVRGGVELLLVDDPAEFARVIRAGRTS